MDRSVHASSRSQSRHGPGSLPRASQYSRVGSAYADGCKTILVQSSWARVWVSCSLLGSCGGLVCQDWPIQPLGSCRLIVFDDGRRLPPLLSFLPARGRGANGSGCPHRRFPHTLLRTTHRPGHLYHNIVVSVYWSWVFCPGSM